jgi:tetratricopeptide (TPR) repeat protein
VLSGTEAVYENNDSKESSKLVEKKVDVPYMNYLEKSMYYFSKQKYKNALNRFQIINQQYNNDLNALFYGGLSNYNLGRFDKAIQDFSHIIELSENPFYEDALWYRAKTYIQINKKNKAKIDLENLALSSSYYQKQALTLLKEL